MPNPPEAALAAREGGTRSAPESSAHRQWTPLARALAAAGDSWTLAIAAELAPGRMRLSTLRGRLAGVSAGLLDRYLQRMARAGLITRSRYREMPPRVEIELTDAGRELLPVASALARWGLRRAWSPPRSEERVDVEALICQLPLLLDLRPPLPDAAVLLVLSEPVGERRWRLDVRGGLCLPLADADADDTAATIAGDAEAWTAAIGPASDLKALRLSGDRALARALLRALAPRGARGPRRGTDRRPSP
jgi:DNA-binding HxlR family transcriptional regulator